MLSNLTNVFYTSKPYIPDTPSDKNVSSISMEEVTPIYNSSENRLAPEEIQTSLKKELKSNTEMTKEDRSKNRKVV